jgi:diguanylate cyclase (GGDEF)-like protein
VLGRNCRFLQGAETDLDDIERMGQAIRSQQPFRTIVRNYRKDGSLFWNNVYLGPVRDGRGVCTHFVGMVQDVSRYKSLEEQVSHQQMHDYLTGLLNTNYLQARLEYENGLINQNNQRLVVMYIDLDDFKPINSGVGYKVGDQLLLQVVKRLKALLAPGDTLVRISGDEFVVVCPGLETDEVLVALADSIVDTIAQPYQVNEHRLQVSASVGVAVASRSLEQPHELIQRASLAMSQAKQQGGNTWQWHGLESVLPASMSELVVLRAELQHAIRSDHLFIHYQPIFDASQHQPCALEALLRWQSPQRGLVSPAEFIPLIERTGQIIEVGRWVLRRVCADIAAMRARGAPVLPVAVNISPLQFRRQGFVDELATILAETGVPAAYLQLEITESMLMAGTDKAIDVLRRLYEMGLRVAIDDFGTGFSSLSYLRRLPISKVKIDRSFVTDLTHDESAAAIVTSIIFMAHHLGLRVVAEGVETGEQVNALKHLGCDELQGFYFAHPTHLQNLFLNR